jgi:imidazolonepropionase-like amidohydrolase
MLVLLSRERLWQNELVNLVRVLPMTREPPEPLRLDYLIRARAIHSMTGKTYRSVGVRGAEIVAVSADLYGLDDLARNGTAVVDAGDLTLLPAFADSHEHLMEASRKHAAGPGR